MRYVDRSAVPEPAVLNRKYKRRKKTEPDQTELERAEDHYSDKDAESFEFSRYKDAEVKSALEALFHGKCAYCESAFSHVHPVDVEHYRPKHEVDGVDGHRGYWWLAMQWDNLLPSCIDCNRRREQRVPAPPKAGTLETFFVLSDTRHTVPLNTGKEALFPLADESQRADEYNRNYEHEQRLLLDPTRDNPAEHLRFLAAQDIVAGLVYPAPEPGGQAALLVNPEADFAALAAAAQAAHVSAMGVVSIQVYGLNRVNLVQERTKLLRDLEYLYRLSVDLETLAEEFGEAIRSRNARLTALTGAAHSLAAADLKIDKEVMRRIKQFAKNIRTRLQELAEPTAPFSALTQAWLTAVLKQQLRSPR